ncbi:MAG: hypothetical protein ABIP95_08370 [Pelobium sp.]
MKSEVGRLKFEQRKRETRIAQIWKTGDGKRRSEGGKDGGLKTVVGSEFESSFIYSVIRCDATLNKRTVGASTDI